MITLDIMDVDGEVISFRRIYIVQLYRLYISNHSAVFLKDFDKEYYIKSNNWYKHLTDIFFFKQPSFILWEGSQLFVFINLQDSRNYRNSLQCGKTISFIHTTCWASQVQIQVIGHA